MSKLLAVIKREYVQGVRSKTFLLSTILGPILLAVFTIVPGLLFGLKTGGATRIAIVDQTGRLYEDVRESILRGGEDELREAAPDEANSRGVARQTREAIQTRYEVEEVTPAAGRPFDEIRRELNERVRRNELDAYLVLPPDILTNGKADYFGRNLGDVIGVRRLEDLLSRAVIRQRMLDASVARDRLDELFRDVRMSTIKVSQQGEEKESGGSFFLAIGVGLFIYIAVLMYGQVILSAVVEEKTSRIAEVLFSSVTAFPLMTGKLIGVSLVALTQYAIWAVLFIAFTLYGAGLFAAGGIDLTLPAVAPVFALYGLLFFLLGFYIYATLYALLGSVVTTEKEGSQLALPIILLLMAGIYMAFPVIRSPDSTFSFWVSMIPFFSPITMLVRIVTETPPFWQIALSFLIGVGTVVFLIWIAARIYRIGMLMYGKRASIPEVLRWIRQT